MARLSVDIHEFLGHKVLGYNRYSLTRSAGSYDARLYNDVKPDDFGFSHGWMREPWDDEVERKKAREELREYRREQRKDPWGPPEDSDLS
jgi:hypothetical protein